MNMMQLRFPVAFDSSCGSEAATQKCSGKIGVLKVFANSQENACVGVSFLIKLFIQKESPTQVFSCQFFEIC